MKKNNKLADFFSNKLKIATLSLALLGITPTIKAQENQSLNPHNITNTPDPMSPKPQITNPLKKDKPLYTKHDRIWKNYYDTTIEILTSAQQRDSLYQIMDNQIDNKIIKLPNDIIKERVVYAFVISEAYGLYNNIYDAISSTTPLNIDEQNIIFEEIRQIGAQGQGAKKQALEIYNGKLPSYSSFDKKQNKELRPKHINNLRRVKNCR